MWLYVWSGLTSRCVTLAHAKYLLKTRGGGQQRLVVVWPIDDACGIHFWEVFAEDMFSDIELKVIELTFSSKKYYDCNKSDGVRLNIKKFHFGKAIYAALLIFMDMFQESKKRLITFIFEDMIASIYGKNYFNYTPPREIGWSGEKYIEHLNNTWRQVYSVLPENGKIFIKAYCGIIEDQEQEKVDFSVIKFREEYWKKVKEIVMSKEKYIGIHIRRTDHQIAIDASSTQAFIRKIDEIINEDDVKFFLATDDVMEEETLKHIYGNRIVVQENKDWGRTNSSEMKSGIIDCLCLSRCEYILGSYTSVFSSFAAKYGNKELIICKDENT